MLVALQGRVVDTSHPSFSISPRREAPTLPPILSWEAFL
jgi:hypothetical protein